MELDGCQEKNKSYFDCVIGIIFRIVGCLRLMMIFSAIRIINSMQNIVDRMF